MNKLTQYRKKLDILYICNSLELGGSEKIMYEIIKNNRKYKKEIICLTSDGYHSKLFENEDVKITYCNLKKNIFDFFKILKLYKFVLKKKPKIIHSFLYHSDVIGSILGKLGFADKILWSVHHDFIKSDNTLLRNIQVKILSIMSNIFPDKIIYCSKESLENHENIGFCKSKSLLIENGICTNKFYPCQKNYFKIRKLLGIKKESFLIGHIARFHPIKGHSILIDCLKLLKQKNTNFKCLMIGKNVNKKNLLLKSKIKKSNLEDEIILYGETKFPQKLINAFDINIISSISESSSLVLMEAMASEIPTIATNVGPISKTIGQSGWVVKNKSSKDLAEKIIFTMNNKPFLKEKSLLSREMILQNYSQEKMLREYDLVYGFYL